MAEMRMPPMTQPITIPAIAPPEIELDDEDELCEPFFPVGELDAPVPVLLAADIELEDVTEAEEEAAALADEVAAEPVLEN